MATIQNAMPMKSHAGSNADVDSFPPPTGPSTGTRTPYSTRGPRGPAVAKDGCQPAPLPNKRRRDLQVDEKSTVPTVNYNTRNPRPSFYHQETAVEDILPTLSLKARPPLIQSNGNDACMSWHFKVMPNVQWKPREN